MSSKWKIGIALILVLALIWILLDTRPEAPDLSIDKWDRESPDRTILERERSSPGKSFDEIGRVALDPEGLVLSGRVLNRDTGAPVEIFHIDLRRREKNRRPAGIFSEGIRNVEGRFAVPLDRGGLHSLAVRAGGFVTYVRDDLQVPEGKGLTGLLIELEPVRGLSGLVVDDSTGLPVEGAFVVAERTNRSGHEELEESTESDASGSFNLVGLRETTYRISVYHGDYDEKSVEARPGEHLLVRLTRNLEFRIYGMVRDDQGRSAPGVSIRLTGEAIDFPVYALSDETGRYVTPSVPPGWVYVKAFLSGENVTGDFEFTEEMKRVRIIDRDLMVDFGPSAEHVTWIGILYGFDGKPVARGEVMVYLEGPQEGFEAAFQSMEVSRTVHCDENGLFQIRKLVPGSYKVILTFPAKYHSDSADPIPRMRDSWREPEYRNYDWGTLTFEGPGKVMKDIRVYGSEILGVVISEKTGEPLKDWNCKVTAERYPDFQKRYSREADEEARFALKGLPPGTYLLSAGPSAYVRGYIEHFKVEKDRVMEGIRIAVPGSGRLNIELRGYMDTEPKSFKVYLERSDGKRKYYLGRRFISNEGTWDARLDLEYGAWILILEGEGLGTIRRLFSIFNYGGAHIVIKEEE